MVVASGCSEGGDDENSVVGGRNDGDAARMEQGSDGGGVGQGGVRAGVVGRRTGRRGGAERGPGRIGPNNAG